MSPDISFVIPAYNEELHIRKCVESINDAMKQSGLQHEIIVVDNGSDDNTGTICQSLDVHTITTPRRTPANARNAGVELARSPVLAFVDSDIRITKRWVSALTTNYGKIRDSTVLTGARVIVPEHPSSIEKTWFAPLSKRRPSYINSGNLLMSAATFRALGGFTRSLETGEDVEMCERARAGGYTIEHNPEFAAIHDGFPRSLNGFFRRELWHGKGDAQDLLKGRVSPVAVVALVFVLLHVVLFAVSWLSTTLFVSIILAIPAVALAMAIRVFIKDGFPYVIRNWWLCYVYLAARGCSLLDVEFLLRKVQRAPKKGGAEV